VLDDPEASDVPPTGGEELCALDGVLLPVSGAQPASVISSAAVNAAKNLST